MLEYLDWLEDHPNLYQRSHCQCVVQAGETDRSTTRLLNCGVYILKAFKKELLSQPFISNYSDSDKCRYICKEQREKGSYSIRDAVKEKLV